MKNKEKESRRGTLSPRTTKDAANKERITLQSNTEEGWKAIEKEGVEKKHELPSLGGHIMTTHDDTE